jgi:hypothetical protein
MDETRFDAWSVGLTGGALTALLTYAMGDRPLSAAASALLLVAGACLVVGLVLGIASLLLLQFGARPLARLRCQTDGAPPLRLATQPLGHSTYAGVGGLVGEHGTAIVDSGDIVRPAADGTLVSAAPAFLFALGVLISALGVLIQSLA